MLFTLISKLPFMESDNSKKKIFKIFVMGSVLYIMLHYYLHSSVQNELLLKFRQYLYYAMGVDFAVAWFLSSKSKPQQSEEDERAYSPEDMQMIQMQQMQRAQVYQQDMQRRQMMGQQGFGSEDDENMGTNRSPFKKMTKKEEINDKKNSSEKEKTPRKDSPKKEEVRKRSEKSDNEGTDTCMPVFMGK